MGSGGIVMKIRNMFGLALIGTAAYAHKQHGGEFTLESIKQSFRDLFDAIQNKADRVEGMARDKARDLAGKVEGKAKDFGDKVQTKSQDVASTTRAYADNLSGY